MSDIEAADQLTYESGAVHGIVLDLCHALGLNHWDVAELRIYPGKVEATIRHNVERNKTKDVAYNYPLTS